MVKKHLEAKKKEYTIALQRSKLQSNNATLQSEEQKLVARKELLNEDLKRSIAYGADLEADLAAKKQKLQDLLNPATIQSRPMEERLHWLLKQEPKTNFEKSSVPLNLWKSVREGPLDVDQILSLS
jgi:seryl-tRNA synthetase